MDQILPNLLAQKGFPCWIGFFGYNQITVTPKDQDNTNFTTHWGTFIYSKMPFGLMNVEANL